MAKGGMALIRVAPAAITPLLLGGMREARPIGMIIGLLLASQGGGGAYLPRFFRVNRA